MKAVPRVQPACTLHRGSSQDHRFSAARPQPLARPIVERHGGMVPTTGAAIDLRGTAAVPVRYAVQNSSSYTAVFVAADRGYFQQEGLDVELIPFSSTSESPGGATRWIARARERRPGQGDDGDARAAARGTEDLVSTGGGIRTLTSLSAQPLLRRPRLPFLHSGERASSLAAAAPCNPPRSLASA